jgi:hypothetical protein
VIEIRHFLLTTKMSQQSTHTRAHARTDTHKHTHTHTLSLSDIRSRVGVSQEGSGVICVCYYDTRNYRTILLTLQ